MARKTHIIKCLNCKYTNRQEYSGPCICCHTLNDKYPHKDKFEQRQGISVRTIDNKKTWSKEENKTWDDLMTEILYLNRLREV